MDVKFKVENRILSVEMAGRLDSFNASRAGRQMEAELDGGVFGVVVNMRGVEYISSAGLRLLAALDKKMTDSGGVLMLAEPHDFCRNVFDIKGVSGSLKIFDSFAEAMGECRRLLAEKNDVELGRASVKVRVPNGEMRFVDEQPGALCRLLVTGDVRDVVSSSVSPGQVFSRSFADSGFSIGVGALGESDAECAGMLGEMMTVSGTMFWLPTDGHDTADFLSLGGNQEKIQIRTPFSVSLPDTFNEFVFLDMDYGKSITLESLYSELFKRARIVRPSFKGVLSAVMIAETSSFWGKCLVRSPALPRPPDETARAVEDRTADSEPRHGAALALLCGVGIDLSLPAPSFDHELTRRIFRTPPDLPFRGLLVENNAAIFKKILFPERPYDIRLEAESIIKDGVFSDFRAAQDISTITRAFMGVSWIDGVDSPVSVEEGAPAPTPARHEGVDADLHGGSRKAALGLYKKYKRR